MDWGPQGPRALLFQFFFAFRTWPNLTCWSIPHASTNFRKNGFRKNNLVLIKFIFDAIFLGGRSVCPISLFGQNFSRNQLKGWTSGIYVMRRNCLSIITISLKAHLNIDPSLLDSVFFDIW